MELTEKEEQRAREFKRYFPFRKISVVKTKDGECRYFADHTYAKANNYTRKTAGQNAKHS